MELNVLTSCDVGDAIRILFREVRQCFELRGVHAPAGYLDALHARGVPKGVGPLGQMSGGINELMHGFAVVPLTVIVTLAIDAPAQPRFGNQAFVEFSLFPQLQLGFEDVNFVSQVFRQFPGEFFLPKRIRSFHFRVHSRSKKPTFGFVSGGGLEPDRFDYRPAKQLAHAPAMVVYNNTWPQQVGRRLSWLIYPA